MGLARIVLLCTVTTAGCAIDTSGLGGDGDGGVARDGADASSFDASAFDASSPDARVADAGGRDAAPDDAGPIDAPIDSGPSDPDAGCVPAPETCNGMNDDCDDAIDEVGCSGCERRTRAGREYLFCTTRRSWPSARAWCVDRSWDLVVLNDSGEDAWVWAEADALLSEDWYMGLHDMREETTYEWVDGTVAWRSGAAVGYENFRGGFPCDVDSEDCIEFDNEASGTWADDFCSRMQPYVCELP